MKAPRSALPILNAVEENIGKETPVDKLSSRKAEENGEIVPASAIHIAALEKTLAPIDVTLKTADADEKKKKMEDGDQAEEEGIALAVGISADTLHEPLGRNKNDEEEMTPLPQTIPSSVEFDSLDKFSVESIPNKLPERRRSNRAKPAKPQSPAASTRSKVSKKESPVKTRRTRSSLASSISETTVALTPRVTRRSKRLHSETLSVNSMDTNDTNTELSFATPRMRGRRGKKAGSPDSLPILAENTTVEVFTSSKKTGRKGAVNTKPSSPATSESSMASRTRRSNGKVVRKTSSPATSESSIASRTRRSARKR